jgi:recombination protein RecT
MATALPAETRRANPVTVIHQNLDQMAPELAKALPAHVSPEKFVRVAKTAIINNPDLQNADRASLFGAIGRLAQDGLLPDGRESAIVLFGNKAQAMPMIAGILKKLRQSGDVAKISAQVVHENDHFVWKLGFDEDVEHNPPALNKPRGNPSGAYATAVLKDGSRLLEVMTLEEIEKVRSVSRAKNNGPWVTWWGEMARKTVMRRLSKRLPMSTDLLEEFDRDPTMATEPQAIEHQPRSPEAAVSRLDALEHQIQPETAETIDHVPATEPEPEVDHSEVIEAQAERVEEAIIQPGVIDTLAEQHAESTDARLAKVEEIISQTKTATDKAKLEIVKARHQETIDALPTDLRAKVDQAFAAAEARVG